jgi:glycosyltransferase involved in cell wall biosynthesis
MALYAGSLEQRVDVRSLEAAARDLHDWTFILVGYLAEPRLFEDLVGLPNVVLSGLVPRPQVLAMMAAADVGLVPHLETPMSVAMSPLKLYEYLGAGTPVVASDLPPMRGISDRCLLVPPGESLTSAIIQAAGLPRLDPANLKHWRQANDWDVRYASWRGAALGSPVDKT